MWQVRLTKAPRTNVYRSDYFPRKMYYKKDAQKLAHEVKVLGGGAVVERAPK